MNDLQKKLAIVGSTAFIVWFLMAFEGDAFEFFSHKNFLYNLDLFIKKAIYGYGYADWIQTTTFVTWLGSLIAFFIYKD